MKSWGTVTPVQSITNDYKTVFETFSRFLLINLEIYSVGPVTKKIISL